MSTPAEDVFHFLAGDERCVGCGAWVTDTEYVTNWCSCNDCWDKYVAELAWPVEDSEPWPSE